MHRVKKFWRLPVVTKVLLLGSVIRLATVSAAVHLIPNSVRRRHWARVLEADEQFRQESNAYDRETIAWSVVAASRFVPGATCLVQAIVAKQLFLKNGFPAEVKIGVTKDQNGSFAAHAWVVCEGQVVLGKDAMREYSEMPIITAHDHP